MNGRRNNQRREQLQQRISLKDTIRAAHGHPPAGLLAVSRKNVRNEHQQVGQFVVRLDRSIYRSLDKIPSVCGTHTVQSSKEPANQSRKSYRKTVVDRSAVSPAEDLETTPILLPTVAALCCGADDSAEGLGQVLIERRISGPVHRSESALLEARRRLFSGIGPALAEGPP